MRTNFDNFRDSEAEAEMETSPKNIELKAGQAIRSTYENGIRHLTIYADQFLHTKIGELKNDLHGKYDVTDGVVRSFIEAEAEKQNLAVVANSWDLSVFHLVKKV